jgi:alkanesulfonate monooxygenase SsuD/methylene tetrahydromethanopterin reductase-like flavin-dependent oxidoreductase (luciferase family)
VGLGTISGQVPSDGLRSVADTYRDILALARIADEIGIDSLWFSEHHGAADDHLPSPIVMLAAAAAVTTRIALGSGVALAPFQHPIRFAEDCAVVDQLSRGRLIVGLAGGWRDEEFVAFGVPRSERIGRTTELAAICRAAWDEAEFSFSGRWFSCRDVRVTPRPVGHLPLLFGGSVPAAAARAGRLADGFIGTPQSDLAVFREQVAAFDEAARAAGRDPRLLEIGFQVDSWVSADGAVPESVRRAMWHKIGTSQRWHAGERVERVEDLPPIDEAAIRRRAFTGTPDDIVAKVRPWVEAFPDRRLHILFRLQHAGLGLDEVEPAARILAGEVVPALKRIAN